MSSNPPSGRTGPLPSRTVSTMIRARVTSSSTVRTAIVAALTVFLHPVPAAGDQKTNGATPGSYNLPGAQPIVIFGPNRWPAPDNSTSRNLTAGGVKGAFTVTVSSGTCSPPSTRTAAPSTTRSSATT